MKVWVEFNAGLQLCPTDFNFAPPDLAKLATPLLGWRPKKVLHRLQSCICPGIKVKTKKRASRAKVNVQTNKKKTDERIPILVKNLSLLALRFGPPGYAYGTETKPGCSKTEKLSLIKIVFVVANIVQKLLRISFFVLIFLVTTNYCNDVYLCKKKARSLRR